MSNTVLRFCAAMLLLYGCCMQLLSTFKFEFRSVSRVTLFVLDCLIKNIFFKGAMAGAWLYKGMGVFNITQFLLCLCSQSRSSLMICAPFFFQRSAIVDFPVPEMAVNSMPPCRGACIADA